MSSVSCTRCGAETTATTANIQINGPRRGGLFAAASPAVRVVEALVCPSCGQITFWIPEADRSRFRP